MKRGARLGGVWAVALALAACQLAPATAAPNAAAASGVPSAAPTATPAAPSPSPAPTQPEIVLPPPPAALGTPTPDPNAGVGAVVFQDPLDDSTGHNWAFESESAVFAILGGQLNAVMKQSNVGFRLRAGPNVSVGDQQVRVTARTNLCYERDEYGLLFRAQVQPDGAYAGYLIKLNCAGQARVEQLRGTASTTLVDWTLSAAIVPGAPAENTLLVWAAGAQFHFFVNDRYLFEAHDASFAAGTYAFYLRDRTNGGESVSFSGLVARALTAP